MLAFHPLGHFSRKGHYMIALKFVFSCLVKFLDILKLSFEITFSKVKIKNYEG